MKIFSGVTPIITALARAGFKFAFLAQIGGERHHFAAISHLEPLEDYRRVEAARIGEDDFLDIRHGLLR
jgi:hypothetical protein